MVVLSGEAGDFLVLDGTVLISLDGRVNILVFFFDLSSLFFMFLFVNLAFLKYYCNPNIGCDSFCCSVQSAFIVSSCLLSFSVRNLIIFACT